MREFFKEFWWLIVFIVVIFAMLGVLAWVSCVNEAKTFNKFTSGNKATAWDAFYIELRVMAE